MALRRRAWTKFAGIRTLSWLVCAMLGGGSLALAATTEGHNFLGPFLFGAGIAGIAAVLRFPCRCPAQEISPEHDQDGLLRTALSVSEDHPFWGRILSESSRRSLRFRPVHDLMPLSFLFCGMVFLFLWAKSDLDVAKSAGETLDPSSSIPSLAESNQKPLENPEQLSDRHDAAIKDLPKDKASLELKGWTEVPALEFGAGKGIMSGLNYGLHPSVVQRFEQLRSQLNE